MIEQIRRTEDAKEVSYADLANLYARVFADPPWNEVFRCGDCSAFFGNEASESCCSGCGGSLVEAYPKEATAKYIQKSVTRPGAEMFLARQEGGNGNEVAGFAWGYPMTIEDFAQRQGSERNGELCRDLLQGLIAGDEFWYFAEVGVAKEGRGQGIGKALSYSVVDAGLELGLQVVTRTNMNSPMTNILESYGSVQIMPPGIDDINSERVLYLRNE